MQTTIADFVLSNPANINAETLGTSDPTLAKQAFEGRITFDTLVEDAEPTMIYVNNNTIIAWYEKNAMVGFI
jgi:hypothetical protein